jgi:hypothetical protein
VSRSSANARDSRALDTPRQIDARVHGSLTL